MKKLTAYNIAHSSWFGWLPGMSLLRSLFDTIENLNSKVWKLYKTQTEMHEHIERLRNEVLESIYRHGVLPIPEMMGTAELDATVSEVFSTRLNADVLYYCYEVRTRDIEFPHRDDMTLSSLTDDILHRLANKWVHDMLKRLEGQFYTRLEGTSRWVG